MFLKFYGVVIEELENYEVIVALGKPPEAGDPTAKAHTETKMKVVARNFPGAAVGQTVQLRLKKQFNREEFILSYILPTVSFFLGFFVVLMFTENSSTNIYPYISGGILLLASLLVYGFRKKHYKAVYKGIIRSIMDPSKVRNIHVLEGRKKAPRKKKK